MTNQLFASSADTSKACDVVTANDIGSIWMYCQLAPHIGGREKRLAARFQLRVGGLLFAVLGLLQAFFGCFHGITVSSMRAGAHQGLSRPLALGEACQRCLSLGGASESFKTRLTAFTLHPNRLSAH